MKLLKIGPLNSDTSRWLDALEVFNEIHVVLFKSNPEMRVNDSRIVYHEIDTDAGTLNFMLRVFRKACSKQIFSPAAKALSAILAILGREFARELQDIDFDETVISYNDFDESGVCYLMIRPHLDLGGFTRAYKETRPGFNWVERELFRDASRIVLNEPECMSFFEQKYGSTLFSGKELIFGVDEDYVSSSVQKMFSPQPKLSGLDGRLHLVILAGRVMSDSLDERSGSRLYYIPMIESFLEAGYCVHIHTLRVLPDAAGIDRYAELEGKSEGRLTIEEPLDFFGEGKATAFETLSRYDFGIMHNYIEGTSNTEFDKYNIPHRYYEYEVAGVVPILQQGKTVVLERLIKESRSGCLYANPKDLDNFDYETVTFNRPTFSDYIHALYNIQNAGD